eukprot:1507187-Rhodomonas_salina.2
MSRFPKPGPGSSTRDPGLVRTGETRDPSNSPLSTLHPQALPDTLDPRSDPRPDDPRPYDNPRPKTPDPSDPGPYSDFRT